jgi:hypothetical protein
MSRSSKAVFTALAVVVGSAGFLLGGDPNDSRLAKEGKQSESSAVQARKKARQEQERQLHKLLLERQQILDKMADHALKFAEEGRVSMVVYTKAKATALRARLDLCETSAERVNVFKQLVKLYMDAEAWTERRATSGRATAVDVDMAKADRLNAQIELTKEELKA